MKIYLAGPMRNYPEFNFPAFKKAATFLRSLGHTVFSPAERDDEVHGAGWTDKYKTGDLKEATNDGFSLRRALYDDTKFICLEGEAIALLPGWERSKGAKAERALSEALGHKIYELYHDEFDNYFLSEAA